ncbi:MAG: type II toxin-antitoxin system VapC family toxin [Acidobacteria bacterium]|nr:type II toxin-antitoxin system VapC family toxin [Acidobacteriota bacterium]
MATASAFDDTPLLLDNDVFTHWRNQNPQIVTAIKHYTYNLKSFPKLPAITIFEAKWGIEKEIIKTPERRSDLAQRQEKIENAAKTFGVLDFNYEAASIAAYIFARLSQSQRNQHWKDVFIAATALAHNYGVATKNQRDFVLVGQHLPPHVPILYLAIWKP